MNSTIRYCLLVLAFAGPMANAQDQSKPEVLGSTTLHPQRGLTVTVRSLSSTPASTKPAPEFGALDNNHDGAISRDEARGFAPLANDFDFADHNRSGSIERAEYQGWR